MSEANKRAQIEYLQSLVAKQRAALESIAAWRGVNISSEYEHGLRDIIRSITDCAAAALEASALSSKRKWDEGEHEGCGIDSQRAYEKEKSGASTLSSQHHNTAQGE